MYILIIITWIANKDLLQQYIIVLSDMFLCHKWLSMYHVIRSVRNIFRVQLTMFMPSFNTLGILGGFVKLWKATIRFVLSARLSEWKNSAPTGRIVMKFDIWVFFEKLSRKFKFQYNRTRIKDTSHEDQYIFLIMSRSFILRVKKVPD